MSSNASGDVATVDLSPVAGDPGGLLGVLGEVIDALGGHDPDVFDVDDVGDMVAACDRQVGRLEAVKLDWAASFASRDGHRRSGHRSLQHFMQDRLRKTPGRARTESDVARRLADGGLDATRRALADGDISADHAAAIANAAGSLPDGGLDAEDGLLAVARDADPGQVKKAGQRLASAADAQAARRQARRAYEQRHLSLSRRAGGFALQGNVHAYGGEKIATVLNALSAPAGADDDRTYGQRLMDALVAMADRLLAADHGDAPGRLPADKGLVTRATVLVPLAELESRAGLQPATLSWAGPCPPQALEQAICDAELDWLLTDPAGLPLAYGQTRHSASRAQRVALRARDGGCRWPGCTAKAQWSLAHHEPPVGTDGWATDLDKLVLLCTSHHSMRHHAGWTLHLDGDATVTITSPDRTYTRSETAAQARARHHHAATHGDPSASDGQHATSSATNPTPGAGGTDSGTGTGTDLTHSAGTTYVQPTLASETRPTYRTRAGPNAARDGPPHDRQAA